jgi:hypothetical protein
MDAVRFGRALGVGARQAAKTLVTAVDAATTESPSSKNTRANTGPGRPAARVRTDAEVQTAARSANATVSQAARTVVQTAAKAQGAKQALRQGRKRFGEAAWRPFVRLSGVLGLEVAGVFFGIFALFGLGTVWRMRGDWHAASLGHRELLGAVAMMVIFGYFCVSSFVRARRRERQR